MTHILHGISGVTCFIDDIVVYGKSKEEHDGNLRAVLQKPADVGMKLNTKCQFNVQSLEFLGHTDDKEGLHPLQNKVESIVKAPVPEDKDQVKSFLGLVGYYAKFVTDFATKVIPILEIMEPGTFQ